MRYAIYFTPRENSALWRAGCRWLGRDAIKDAELEQPDVPAVEAVIVRELTAAPRRYGFHATLKAPFRLISGTSEGVLLDAVTDFADRGKPFCLPDLIVGKLGSFLALQSCDSCEELQMLAAACVSEFDRFREPESVNDQARRADGLDERQRAYLENWGYPYVMDQWRFHMTLTKALPDSQLPILEGFLNDWFAPALAQPVWVQDLCVCVEPEPGCNFVVADRFPLKG